MSLPDRKPDWLRVRLPSGEGQASFTELKKRLEGLELNTVCEEARCPNIFECWSAGTATIMILGETCTRGCRFCSVQTGKPGGTVDVDEPARVAEALSKMNLAYVVMTMVDRDDLPDGGAVHVSKTIQAIRARCPSLRIETLSGDFRGERAHVETVVQRGAPDVFAHNVEVVPRLQRPIRDARCSWDQSLRVLRWAKDAGAKITKSSLMVGIGETDEEVLEALASLRTADIDVVTLGQYLRPSRKQAKVARYVDPATFEMYREEAIKLGFRYVASGPLVRSSYRAAEAFMAGMLNETDGEASAMNRYGKKTTLRVVE